jgi:hypothetical protein
MSFQSRLEKLEKGNPTPEPEPTPKPIDPRERERDALLRQWFPDYPVTPEGCDTLAVIMECSAEQLEQLPTFPDGPAKKKLEALLRADPGQKMGQNLPQRSDYLADRE